jgi:hypothetical protein
MDAGGKRDAPVTLPQIKETTVPSEQEVECA